MIFFFGRGVGVTVEGAAHFAAHDRASVVGGGSGFQDLGGRVVVAVRHGHHPVVPLALVRGTLHQPERAVPDGGQQRRVVWLGSDPLEQLDCLVEHLVRARLDEATGLRVEVLGQLPAASMT